MGHIFKLLASLVGIFILLMSIWAMIGGISDQASPNWRQAAEMDVKRSEIYAARLGDEIVTLGGIGFFEPLSDCAAFDLYTEQWRDCPDLPYALHHVALTGDGGENIYASGGFTALPFIYDDHAKIWRLSKESNAWEIEASLPYPLGEHGMIKHGEDIYFIGGAMPSGTTAMVKKYNLKNKTWTDLSPMPTPRHSAGYVLQNDQIWVIGGRNGADANMDVVEIYDILTDSWKVSTPLPSGRGGHAAVAYQGQIHVIGGEYIDGFKTKMLPDHYVTHGINQDWQILSRMPKARHGHAGIATENGIYIIGGGKRPAYKTPWSITGNMQIYEK